MTKYSGGTARPAGLPQPGGDTGKGNGLGTVGSATGTCGASPGKREGVRNLWGQPWGKGRGQGHVGSGLGKEKGLENVGSALWGEILPLGEPSSELCRPCPALGGVKPPLDTIPIIGAAERGGNLG